MGGSDKAKMKAWLIHPTGNRNVRAAAHALESSGLLETFHSCLSIGHDCPNPLASRLFAQRRFDIPDDRIKRHMLREGLRLFAQKLGFLSSLLKHETGPLSIDQVYHSLDSAVAGLLEKTTNCPEAIYAYEDGAFEVFSVAKRRGIHRIYDLPIGYWRAARRIQAEEAERQPAWAMTMPALRDSESKLSRKDEELGLAERIYVASSFTASTLSEVPFEIPQATVIPYGCPAPILDRTDFARPTERLRVLYVGSLGQRKGLSYLLEAVDQLGDSVELTLVGRRVAACKPLDEALQRFNWIESLPHDQILETMRKHDVFVFPSLFEGFGLVLTEALSQGLPIISTKNTCAPDMIKDGREGFIVPIRNSEAIASKLQLLNKDRDQLHAMKEAAILAATKTTWDNYKIRLARSVAESMKGAST